MCIQPCPFQQWPCSPSIDGDCVCPPPISPISSIDGGDTALVLMVTMYILLTLPFPELTATTHIIPSCQWWPCSPSIDGDHICPSSPLSLALMATMHVPPPIHSVGGDHACLPLTVAMQHPIPWQQLHTPNDYGHPQHIQRWPQCNKEDHDDMTMRIVIYIYLDTM